MTSPVDFTFRFQKVLSSARGEAVALGCTQIEPGHVLLALLGEEKGTGRAVLSRIGVDRGKMRERLRAALLPALPSASGQVFVHSENAKRALELSMAASRDLGHSHIGTEHLLLALLRVSDSVAARELEDAGVTFERAQHEITEVLADPGSVNGETEDLDA
jgi:ATP-dependent Clp protease ATP-binding subunit ClpC